jgi:hypothetical protein
MLRRLAGTRRCFLTQTAEQVKAAIVMETELAKVLPDNLKSIIEHGPKARAELAALEKEKPELVAAIREKITNMPSKIVATVSEPRDPKLCKYTIEGSMTHDALKAALKMERVSAYIADVDVKMSAADKAMYKEQMLANMAGVNAAMGKLGGYFATEDGENAGGYWKVTEADVLADLQNNPLPDTVKLGDITKSMGLSN